MNIYFACSITGGREFERVYQDLVAALVMDGHEVPTAHLAESSVPSHGVGYEIGFALNLGKPVLCLFQEGRKISKMISGNPHSQLQVMAYRDSNHAIEFLNV